MKSLAHLLLLLVLVPACAGQSGPAAATGTPSAGSGLAAAAAGTPAAGSPALEPPLPVDPAVKVGTLPTGLRYYVRTHKEPQKRAALRLVVDAGSVMERDDEQGFAHFVEHMAFNGTRLFKKQEIVDYIEKVGMRFGRHANASTSFDETLYMFQIPTDDAAIVEKAFVILQQLASDVTFDPAEVNSERAVVIEEWRSSRGAGMRAAEKLLPVIFKGSRYAERQPIGKKEILERATAEALRAFYKRWYRPDTMAVIAVGDFDPAVIEGHIKKIFGPVTAGPDAPKRPSFPVPAHDETLVSVVKDKELPATTVGVVYKLPRRPLISRADYRRHVVDGLYHTMVNGRLDELRRVTDAPFLFAASTTQSFVRPTDVFLQIAGVKQDGVARGLEALTREVERIDRHGFTRTELEREKGDLLRQMERAVREKDKVNSAQYAGEMVEHFLRQEAMPGVERELALTKEFLPTITLEEMNRAAAELITEKNRVVVVQAPEAATVPPETELRALFDRTQKQQLEAYVDKVGEGALVDKLPPPGKKVRESRVDPLGVTEWRLDNGVRVVIKPTDFKNDEVLMMAFSPGGHSLSPDRDYQSAVHAAAIVDSSGAGRFGPTELRKALSGKVVSVSPFIEELEEGFTGQSSPDDIETLLQLVHLLATSPRRDEQSFAAYKAQLAEQVARRLADPETVFGDKWVVTMFNNHLRRRPPTAEDVEKVTLDAVLRVYRDRFKDMGDFTFVFVGQVAPDRLLPLAQKYLATLPTARRKERWRDVGARPVGGIKRFDVAMGSEPKSTVAIAFTGMARWSREEAHRLDSLTEALSIRLREVLREDLGGTYGVQLSGELGWRPVQLYSTEVNFTCAPDNVGRLTEAVYAEIRAARSPGLSADHVTKVKTAQKRAHEVALRNNGYWVGRLTEHYRHGTDPKQILDEPKLIEALDAAQLKAAAAKYFDEKRQVVGVLKPAATPAPAAASKPAAKVN
jgi:zinc protease